MFLSRQPGIQVSHSGGEPPVSGKRVRRDDIQGLRAVGALLVAIYHIWIGRVSGGVDVFLVVSGYLLVGSLSRQAIRRGTVDLFSFVTRLARRLLPAAFTVLAVVAVSAPFWQPRMQWIQTIDEIAASAAYVENWYLAFASVDYLARDTLRSPVQHYWAMSVQVQALLLIALALAITCRIARWRAHRIEPRTIEFLLVAVFAGSFAYAVVTTRLNQTFAYFDTFARVWEFALGGLAAIGAAHVTAGPRSRMALGWLALAAILSCGIVLDVSTSFPGIAALWPTLAAAALLVLGEGAVNASSAFRWLASRPLVWLGNRAYALYLWHWPVLVVWLVAGYREEVSLAEGLAILAISIALADVTLRFVEQPARTWFETRREPWTIAGTAAALVVLAGVLLAWSGATQREMRAEQAVAAAPPTARLGAPSFPNAVVAQAPVTPGPITAKWDNADVYRDGCHQTLAGDAVLSCIYGRPDAPARIALVGGSHSAHWLPALQEIVARHPRWQVETFTKSGCAFSDERMETNEIWVRTACDRWNAALIEKLLRHPPDIVVTLATRAIGGPERIPHGYRSQWLKLTNAGIPVVALRDTPSFDFDVPACVEINGPRSPICERPRNAALPLDLTTIDFPEGVHPVDMSDRFCTAHKCPVVVGNVLVYYDAHHVSASYMRSLAPALETRLMPLIDRLAPVPGT